MTTHLVDRAKSQASLNAEEFVTSALLPDEPVLARYAPSTRGANLNLAVLAVLVPFALATGSTGGAILLGLVAVVLLLLRQRERCVVLTPTRVLAASRWPGQAASLRTLPREGIRAGNDGKGGVWLKAADGTRLWIWSLGLRSAADLVSRLSTRPPFP